MVGIFYAQKWGDRLILQEEIRKQANMIAKILMRGNNAEIKKNSDGTVKVYEVRKKIVRN